MTARATAVSGQDDVPPRAETRSADKPRDEYSFKARFGALIAVTGGGGISRALCHYLGELGLSYADLRFITYILSYRWTSAYPFPAQRRLADQAGPGRGGSGSKRACPPMMRCVLAVAEDDGLRKLSTEYRGLLERTIAAVITQPVRVDVVSLENEDAD